MSIKAVVVRIDNEQEQQVTILVVRRGAQDARLPKGLPGWGSRKATLSLPEMSSTRELQRWT